MWATLEWPEFSASLTQPGKTQSTPFIFDLDGDSGFPTTAVTSFPKEIDGNTFLPGDNSPRPDDDHIGQVFADVIANLIGSPW